MSDSANLYPLESEHRALLAMESIERHLPIRVGKRIWSNFGFHCSVCRSPIPSRQVHGQVTSPVPDVAVMEALGTCQQCQIGTPFYYRFNADGTVTKPEDFRRIGAWQPWLLKPELKREPSWGELANRLWKVLGSRLKLR